MDMYKYAAAALDNTRLRLIIMPTERCNFRCTYCYEDFAQGQMRQPTIEAIEKLVRNRIDGVRSVQISWFGGEPLIALSVVNRLTRSIKSACSESGVAFYCDITTNAFLMTEIILREIYASGVNEFQITLDGIKDDHDRTRIQAGGKPTFERILQNLKGILESDLDVHVLLRLHYSKATLPRLLDFSAWAKKTFGMDERFSFSIREIEALGGPNDDSHIPVRLPADIAIVERAKELLAIRSENDGELHLCYAGSVHSLVIRADGSIGKCTVALNDPRNRIGLLNDNGTVQLDSYKTAAWTEAALSGNRHALECPLHYLG